MSQDYTIAMLQKGRAEGIAENRDRWKAHAKQMEEKVIQFAVMASVERELVGEMLKELRGEKPTRLSDPSNKPLRVRFRDDAKRPLEQQYRQAGAANLEPD